MNEFPGSRNQPGLPQPLSPTGMIVREKQPVIGVVVVLLVVVISRLSNK